MWTVHSDGRGSHTLQRYRSFEDIPASPRVRSRRVSVDNAFGSGLALSVLKDSYKGFDSAGDVSPRIKKLQKNFSFHDSLQDFKTTVNINDEKGGEDLRRDDEMEGQIQFPQPVYRSISIAQTSNDLGDNERPSPRQRRIGIPLHRNLSFQEFKKSDVNLRKEILKQTLPDFKSCENLLFQSNAKISRRDSAENSVKAAPPGLTLLKDSYQGVQTGNTTTSKLRKLKSNFSFVSPLQARDGAAAHGVDRRKSDAKYEYISTNTSNTVEISSHCDCRFCSEEDRKDRMSLWRRIFCIMFMKAVSINDDRQAHWDENNNVDAGEMYKCVMQTFKLLFGLWLRHFDHN